MIEEAELFYHKAIVTTYTEQYDVAEYCLLKSIEIDPSEHNCASLGWLYAVAFESQEKKALRFFRKAIFCNPANGDLYNDYGALLLRMGLPKNSIKWFKKAARFPHCPKRHFALYNLALAYYNSNHFTKSRRFLRLALKSRPDFEQALHLYSVVNSSIGK